MNTGEPTQKSHLLINEPPLQVLPSLATAIGLNEAIVLQQIHYWLSLAKGGVVVNGRKWIYNSLEEWKSGSFPFWSIKTIARTIKTLVKNGLVLRAHHSNQAMDRTWYYTIDYDALNRTSGPPARGGAASGQVGVLQAGKLAGCLTETTLRDSCFTSSDEEVKAPAPNDADGASKTSECDVPVSSPPQESQTTSVPASKDQKEEKRKRTRRETPLDATVKAIIRVAWGKDPDDEVIRKRYWRRAAALRKVLAAECGEKHTLRPAYVQEFYADWAGKNPNMSLPTSSLKLPGIFGEWWDAFKEEIPDDTGNSHRVFTHERLPWATFHAVKWINWRLYLAEEPGALIPTIIVFDKDTGTEVKEEKKPNPNGEQSESHTGRDGPVLRDGGTPAAQSGPEGQVSGVHQGVHGDGPRPGQLRQATGTVSGNTAGSDPAHP